MDSSLKFLPDVLKTFQNDTLRLTVTLCVVFAVLAYAFFKGDPSSKIRFSVFVLVAVFFGIVIAQLNSTLKVAPQAPAPSASVEAETSPTPQAPATDIEIPAATYARGQNVARGPLPNLYGADVLMNAPPFNDVPNAAEFDVFIPVPGRYTLSFRYAAAVSRPIDIFVNGELAVSEALNAPTGGWLPADQAWFIAGTVILRKGPNTIRIQRSSVFPHITSLKLTPLPP